MDFQSSTHDEPRRLTAKQAEAQERRSRMTQRRHEMANRIRKEKKSKYLARKRNLVTVAGNEQMAQPETAVMTQINTLNTLFQAFVQSPSATSLKSLEHALRTCNISQILKSSIDNPLVLRGEAPLAISVMTLLGRAIQPSSFQADSERSLALQTLVHLTAIPTDTSAIVEGNYYGKSDESWCSCLVQVSGLLSSIVQLASHLESPCIILGNLAGDHSQEVRRSLRDLGVVESLVGVLRQGSANSHSGVAAWALTNIIRNDDTSFGKRYCSDAMLSPELLVKLLLLPEQQPQSLDKTLICTISTQTAWMIASLTSREPDTINYLCSHTTFCPALVRALEASDPEQQRSLPGHEDPRLPLIQAIGHVASYAPYVPPLLSLNLAPLLRLILQRGTGRGPTFAQAAWLAGCLICDAGAVGHPSTTIAAPVLIPILVDLLSQERASVLTLDEKREVVCALWNGIAPPPSDYIDYGGNNTIPAQVTQLIPLPGTRSLCMMLPVLVTLLKAPDVDAVLGAVNVLSILLRRSENSLRTAFGECNGKESLENLCDSSQNEKAAEVAADLLDDILECEDNDDGMVVGSVMDPSQQCVFGGGFHAVPSGSNPNEAEIGGGMGRGRGRGATLPSWMTRN